MGSIPIAAPNFVVFDCLTSIVVRLKASGVPLGGLDPVLCLVILKRDCNLGTRSQLAHLKSSSELRASPT